MTDWEKLKVADLKEELKSRGIPLTGLKLKQQFVDRLTELEGNLDNDELNEVDAQDSKDSSADGERDSKVVLPQEEQQSSTNEQSNEAETQFTEGDTSVERKRSVEMTMENGDRLVSNPENGEQQLSETKGQTTNADCLTGEARVERISDELPAEMKTEESQARDGTTPPPVVTKTAAEEKVIETEDPFVPQQAVEGLEREPTREVDRTDDMKTDQLAESELTQLVTSGPSHTIEVNQMDESLSEQTSSTGLSTTDIVNDRLKRKRRSVTPVPDAQDVVQKRAKTNESMSIAMEKQSGALRRVQEATDAAQAIRNPVVAENDVNVSGVTETGSSETYPETHDSRHEISEIDLHAAEYTRQRSSHSPADASFEESISPAFHSATRSLYIRNFKRPLHIPTLRSHMSSLASSSNDEPITVFYLDSIRTHAFISFTSVSAASRVRNAMHGARFPDEPMREPLWIDFIPDEKVQTWIDQETGSGGGAFGGGRGASKKYEVVYDDSSGSTEARLQEVSASSMLPQRQGFQTPQPTRIVPQNSTASTAVVSRIHPSRGELVSHPRSTRPLQPSSRPSDLGTGFRALDELFSSTTTKPKIYYKLVPQPLIDERLDMMRDLRVGHDLMGQSGDEGMKRYSFERDEQTDQERWVDKGPEFGFGRRGQERLTGFGSNYGGSRARMGFRGARRGGDSWRGR